MRFLPLSATPTASLILITRGMRAVADGFISVLLPAYLLALGYDAVQVGVLTTATLLGSALPTLAFGFYGTRAGVRTLLLATSLLMLATGIGFAAASGFWALLLIAFVGTLNPSAGDVSVFLPLEQTALSGAIGDRDRTDLFARYSTVGHAASSSGSPCCSASMPSPAGWSSSRCWPCGCSRRSDCRLPQPRRSSLRPTCCRLSRT